MWVCLGGGMVACFVLLGNVVICGLLVCVCC